MEVTGEGSEVVGGPMSDDMAWDRVYQLALRVAEEHGAQISEAARVVGEYNFLQRVRTSPDGVVLVWTGKPA